MRKNLPVFVMLVLFMTSCSSTMRMTDSGFVYKDGTYVGEEPNWPSMIVEVTIQKDRIQKVRFIESNGTQRYTEMMIPEMPNRVMAAGNLNVDAVTGATLSCDNFLIAVKDAMGKAKK